MNRKQRRNKKKTPEDTLSERAHLFGKIPEQCDVCQRAFDKTDREMAYAWHVVVREQIVRLFCPDCIAQAQEILTEFKKETDNES